jgi:nitrous oxide reductase accessory protein NosL
MKRLTFTILLLLTAVLAACSGSSETAVPAQQPVTTGSTGKPQLIEFYADW